VIVKPLPTSPTQLRDVVRDYGRHALNVQLRLHRIAPDAWRNARQVRCDPRRGRLRIPYGNPYTGDQGEILGLVVELRWVPQAG